MHAVLGARLKRGWVCQHHSCKSVRKSCDISVIFTPIVEEIAVFCARSKGGPASHFCCYLKNQEEYLINMNIILDDRKEKQAKPASLDQSGARSTEKTHGNGNFNIKSIQKKALVFDDCQGHSLQ